MILLNPSFASEQFLTELSKLCTDTNADFLPESQVRTADERMGRIVYDDSAPPYHFKGERCCLVERDGFVTACRRLGLSARVEACVFDGRSSGTEYLILTFVNTSVVMYIKKGRISIRDWDAD